MLKKQERKESSLAKTNVENMVYRAACIDYTILKAKDETRPIYPYLRSQGGDKEMWCISPIHGRSYVVGRNEEGRYIVSKGNGLSYSEKNFMNTHEMGNDTWGLLLQTDAIRDFTLGIEIANLGIKTNIMEYVLELNKVVTLPNDIQVKPVLLQYSVECPYRICDAAYITKQQIYSEAQKWKEMNDKGYKEFYMIAANVLIQNLHILHTNNILHNAIHSQNYTWALELLDFELACSPATPYERDDYRRHVKDLFPRELIQTYEIINNIAWCLNEEIDYKKVDDLFAEYGFNLSKH